MTTTRHDSSDTSRRTVQQAPGLWRTGVLEYQVEGQPTRTYNAGEALNVPAGVVHAVRNVGTGNAAELATYVVEKAKPLLTLAQ